MYRKVAFLCAILSFSFLTLPSTPARAVDGPGDALALVATAISGVTSGFAAYAWHQSGDPYFLLNQLAALDGEDSWASWFMQNAGSISITTAIVTAGMMSRYCTHTGIAAIDNRFGWPRR